MIFKYSYSVQQKQNSFSKYSVLTDFLQNMKMQENVQIQTGKGLNITLSEASLAFLKSDLKTPVLGEVIILPLLLHTIWKFQSMSLD